MGGEGGGGGGGQRDPCQIHRIIYELLIIIIWDIHGFLPDTMMTTIMGLPHFSLHVTINLDLKSITLLRCSYFF